MNWISKINGVFKVMGLSINAASLCTFFSVVILFFVILYGILQVLFKKKKIDSTTKKFLSICGAMGIWFSDVYAGANDLFLYHELF